MREKRKKNIIIVSLFAILFMMTIGYSAFQTQLNINGTANISSKWGIKIISADVLNINGDAENVKNTYTDLTANLEANLYSKGDYVEYKIMVENSGTFDAKLETLGITNSNNEAVKITSSGFVKGQTLYKNTTEELIVKIEYNSNYSGDAGGTSGESTITLDFVQAEGGTIVPTTDHLVTYDYVTNGGESTTAENEYIAEGSDVDLSYTASRKNYEFLGWSQNPQGTTALERLTMGTEDITLYAIFKAIDTTPPVISNISVTSTTNSATVTVTATEDKTNIVKYEYSIDGGITWIESTNNIYTFNDLAQGTDYTINVRVTNSVELYSVDTKTVTTATIEKPTFSESGTTTKTVTITYPSGCGSTYTCTYTKDSGTEVTVKTTTADVEFTNPGNLVAKVSDGKNTASSSYAIKIGRTVTYDYSTNGGTSATKTSAIVDEGSALDLTPTATKDGWTFVGWNTNKDATTKLTSLTMGSSNVTLYAIYRKEAVTLTAKFNANGAMLSSTSNQTCQLAAVYNKATQATSCTVDAPTITRSGYTIIGYNTSASSKTNNSSYSSSTGKITLTSSNDNNTWYAITSKGITITFNKNGAKSQTDASGTASTGDTVTRTCTMYNADTTCSVTSPTIVGSDNTPTVVGYNTSASGTTSAWDHNTAKSVSANATYYAITTKEAVTLTAKFNANGATLSSTADKTCQLAATYNGTAQATSCTVDAPTITRDRYNIIGYNTTASSTTNNSSYNLSTGKLTLTSSNNNSTWYAITTKDITIIKSWQSNSTTDFHNSTYKDNIITATFEDAKVVPANAVESWDVSAAGDGSVMAWVIADTTDSTKYHLYIGGNFGVIANENSSYLFNQFTNLTSIDFGQNFDTSSVTNMGQMFAKCNVLTSLDLSSFNTSSVTDMKNMFNGCSSLTSLDVTGFNTSKVTDMGRMFGYCESLTSLDITNFDTSSVTNMRLMFFGCSGLTSLDVTGFNTSKVTDMVSMFYDCSALTSLDVTGFDTSKVTDMNNMFTGCSSLTSLDLSSFNTSKVTNMSAMFSGCNNLTSLNVSNFDTSLVTDMEYMFYYCSQLTRLNLCSFNTSNVTNYSGILINMRSLNIVTVGPNWTLANNNINYGRIVSSSSSSECVVVFNDVTPPTCTTSGGSSSWVASSQTITGTCSDSESGCVNATVSKTYSFASTTSGSYDSSYSPGTVSDKAGNTATCPNAQVRVTGITLDDYKTGAQVMYDGKTGLSSTTWTDQSSTTKRNGTLVNATKSTNSVYFNGTSAYVRIAQLNYSSVTMESTFKATKSGAAQHIASNVQNGGYMLALTANTELTMGSYKNGGYIYSTSGTVSTNTMYYGAGRSNNQYQKVTLNTTQYSKNAAYSIGTTGSSTYLVLGSNPSGKAGDSSWFKGYIYSFRLYNSILTDDQLQKHYVIDKARFGY